MWIVAIIWISLGFCGYLVVRGGNRRVVSE